MNTFSVRTAGIFLGWLALSVIPINVCVAAEQARMPDLAGMKTLLQGGKCTEAIDAILAGYPQGCEACADQLASLWPFDSHTANYPALEDHLLKLAIGRRLLERLPIDKTPAADIRDLINTDAPSYRENGSSR